MRRFGKYALVAAAIGALGLGAVGCADTNTVTDHRIRQLSDDDGDGLMTERAPAEGDDGDESGDEDGDGRPDDGGIMWPDPGDCPLLEWRETHTVVYDAEGNVVSETYEVCMQCMNEDGEPVGDETCYDEPPLPPDVFCEEYETDDPALACYRCYGADGGIVEDACYEKPRECTSDADCPEGQVCYIYDYYPDGSMGEDRDGDGVPDGDPSGGGTTVGYCGLPDPCVMVDSLPSDPTGESCWQCTDPATGEDWGSWCDLHACGDDGSCVNEWEVCDPAGSGYCVYDDPCDPVDSLPEDPTGESCWACTDPMSGEGHWGWCDVHRCADDGTCANPYDICEPDSGYCVYDDPCDPVDSLPGDPTGSDCYSCTDPETGADMGGWCNLHPCETDEECYELGLMCGCGEDGNCIID